MHLDHIKHLNISAEIAEKESADLRLRLRRAQELLISSMVLCYRREQLLIPLLKKLVGYEEISQTELDHAVACLAVDLESINTAIAEFRGEWGCAPTRNGRPIFFEEKKSEIDK